MAETARSNRVHITFYGRRNVGKSSLVNALCGQEVSIVSPVAGTTTDVVWKNIELPGIGASVIGDTAGYDDTGELGVMRVDVTRKSIARTDVAVIVLHDNPKENALEKEWQALFKKYEIPTVFVVLSDDNKQDTSVSFVWANVLGEKVTCVHSLTKKGCSELLEKISESVCCIDDADDLTYSLAKAGDVVVLVMPQDSQAPKGRLIQPQVQTLRNLLDKHCIPLCCASEELPQLLSSLVNPPSLVITDSQVFVAVEKLIPPQTKLTSFSLLMARHKGDISVFCQGAEKLLSLNGDSKILIAEACSHIPQNEDIGRVKLPCMLRNRFGDGLTIDVVSGNDFPEDLSGYDLVIHCGACMFTRRHVMYRLRQASLQGVPITNYGVAIAALTGILNRVVM
ncbi:MAG: [FeFe] hydrogenase H-cluster maturation GTPase HydF [Bacteroidaceae bacterium]|nr:[FeFe] hydrogenase H-cluster maturation GTPase HydF [Bacteroidaceae bacterium]